MMLSKLQRRYEAALSLACALVHNPRLAVLDEPTVGVDPELRRSFWDYFAQLNKEGVTIIVSTHHLDEASRCTRLGLMRSGALLAQDAPQELLRQSGKDNMEDAFLALCQSAGGTLNALRPRLRYASLVANARRDKNEFCTYHGSRQPHYSTGAA